MKIGEMGMDMYHPYGPSSKPFHRRTWQGRQTGIVSLLIPAIFRFVSNSLQPTKDKISTNCRQPFRWHSPSYHRCWTKTTATSQRASPKGEGRTTTEEGSQKVRPYIWFEGGMFTRVMQECEALELWCGRGRRRRGHDVQEKANLSTRA